MLSNCISVRKQQLKPFGCTERSAPKAFNVRTPAPRFRIMPYPKNSVPENPLGRISASTCAVHDCIPYINGEMLDYML